MNFTNPGVMHMGDITSMLTYLFGAIALALFMEMLRACIWVGILAMFVRSLFGKRRGER